jgi:conjugative relaxase-like TrwC/TraI family protein
MVSKMIFINHQRSAKAAKDYYTQHIAPGDGKYYTEENAAQMKGVWYGRGAEMLKLSGEVKQEDFFRLCDNINPSTGKRLTARTDDDRRVMTDVTFTLPKSVTLAYELGGHNGGGDTQVLNAVRESVQETMADIEADAKTRVRKGGEDTDRPTGSLIWAEHVHRTSRPVTDEKGQRTDADLHIHATTLNATFDPVEKRWKAVQLSDVFRDKGWHQSAFHARLASKLKAIGFGIEKDGKSFKLAGISKETTQKFSRRTAVIEAEAERLGIDDAASKSKLGRRTREAKNKDKSMEELRKEWDSRLTVDERVAIRTAGSGWEKGDAAITPEEAKQYALDHSFQNASAVSEKRLKQEALTYAVGSIKPEDVADIAQHPEVISRQYDGQLFTTTKEVLRDEVSMLQFARSGQRGFKPLVNAPGPNPALAGLSDEQKNAALHILNSRDTVTGLTGKAGTGKTTLMRATRDAIESVPGQHVFAFAPSAQASRGVLSTEGFKEAETLAMLLKSPKMQEKTKGQVLWIDEAGLVSSKDMRALMDIAKRNGNRVVLSGDYTQHSSVEAGDAFRLLEKEAGVKLARLTEIRRQTEPGYKKAVEAIAEGSGKAAQKGFDALDKMGLVIEARGEERHKLLVADYLKAKEEGKTALIISPTHAEGERLTEELRGTLKERGVIGRERDFTVRRSTGWSDAQKGDIRNYESGMVIDFNEAVAGARRRVNGVRVTENSFAKGEAVVVTGMDRDGVSVMRRDGTAARLDVSHPDRFQVSRSREITLGKGDRIRITKNGEAKVEGQPKGTKVNNGDIFTVEGFTREGDIRLGDGKVLPKGWGHMSLGYTDTSYASQSKTTDRVFISVGKESIPAANQQQWYVSASRGREMAKVYVDSKEDVREAIARTGERLSAVELTHTRLRGSWRHRFYQSLERNRVGRFLKARANAISDYWRDRGRGMEGHG